MVHKNPLHFINIFGLLSSLIYVTWLIQSVQGGTSLISYLNGTLLAFLLLFTVFTKQNINQPNQLQRIIFWAILFRALGLFAEPILEDDDFRYLWDGYRFVTSGTPYGIAPAEFFTADNLPKPMLAILDRVNYPEIPTLYGPVSQSVFALAYLIFPASLLTLKCLIFSFDIAGLLLLKRFAANNFFIFYAWNPLIIKEIAFSAHHDAIGIFFLILALYAYSQKKCLLTASSLGLAVSVKLIALLIVPLMLYRLTPRAWVIFAITVSCCYLPFLINTGATDLIGLFRFAESWEFNSSVFALLQRVLDSASIRLFSVGILIAGVIVLLPSTSDRIARGDILFAILLLLSPVVNPWYILWLLPFAVIYPSRWAWLTSMTVSLSYITGLNLNDAQLSAYDHPYWVRIAEYIPIALALFWDWYQPLPTQSWQIKN